MTQATCKGLRADGQPCGGPVADSEGYCIEHTQDETLIAKRDAGKRKGGLVSQARERAAKAVDPLNLPEVRLESAADCLALQERAIAILLAQLERNPGDASLSRELSLAAKRAADTLKVAKLEADWNRIFEAVKQLQKGKDNGQ